MASKSLKGNVSRSSFWGIRCESGKKYTQVVTHRFHISMAALDPTVVSTSPCVSLMVERGGSQYLLCNLVPETTLQVNLDLYFEKGEEVTFSLKGVGTVHLSGYHIYGENDSQPTNNSNLKFETTTDKSKAENKIHQTKKNQPVASSKGKTKLSAVNYNVVCSDDDSSDDSEDKDETGDLNKLFSKKRTIETFEDDDDSDEDDEDFTLDYDEDDDSEEEEEEDDSEEDDEDEDDEDMSSGESGDVKIVHPQKKMRKELKKKVNEKELTPAQELNKKKKQVNASTPLQVKGISTKPGEMNSSIAKTPMPKKSVSFLQNSKANDSAVKMNISSESDKNKSSNPLNTTDDQSSAKKKKKRKKKKNSLDQSGASESTPSKLNETNKTPSKADASTPATPQYSKKLQGGIEFDDIRVGHGPPAMKGKLVHVYYTGKLENNKVFDSCAAGSKPFSFKLGIGQVIKGWDLAIDGMKVGGKRRIKIPPHFAYGNKKTGPIPPNSTLHFTVELKAVS